MLEAILGTGFMAWLGIASAVTVGVLGAVLIVQLVREVLEAMQEAWERLWQWWQR